MRFSFLFPRFRPMSLSGNSILSPLTIFNPPFFLRRLVPPALALRLSFSKKPIFPGTVSLPGHASLLPFLPLSLSPQDHSSPLPYSHPPLSRFSAPFFQFPLPPSTIINHFSPTKDSPSTNAGPFLLFP